MIFHLSSGYDIKPSFLKESDRRLVFLSDCGKQEWCVCSLYPQIYKSLTHAYSTKGFMNNQVLNLGKHEAYSKGSHRAEQKTFVLDRVVNSPTSEDFIPGVRRL